MIRSATQGSTDALAEGLSGTAQNITIAIAIGAVLALVLAAVMRRQVLGAGEDSAAERSSPAVEQDGAAAHPRRRVATLGWVAVALALLLFALPADSWGMRAARSAAFVVGVAFSAVLGYFARTLALRADIRVAAAAGTGAGGYERDLRLASRTGGVVGLTTVGLGLLGAAIAVLVYGRDAPILLEGLGLGAAVSAVFLRLGARTGTGAADIGMAPDLFGSYVVTIAAAVFLGPGAIGDDGLVLPLLIPAIGAVAAALAVLLVRVRQGVPGPRSIRNEFSAGVGVALLGAALACFLVLPSRFSDLTGAGVTVAALNGDPRTVALGAVFLGILLVVLIRWISAHVSSVSRPPLVPPGFGSGLESAVYTTLVIAGALYLAFLLAGGVLVLATFLVALVGCGVLSTVGVIVAMDTVVRVSDNTRGIAEMEGDVDEEGGAVRTGQGVVADPVKATTRALATATAVIAATAVFVSFRDTVITELSDFAGTLSKPPSSYLQTTIGDAGVSTPTTLIGVLLGAAVVFLCAGLTMDAVGQARRDIVRELPTGLLALFAPVAVGFGLGVAPLAGFLGGAIATGVLLAVSCSNSGATTLRGDTVEPDRLRGDAVMDSAVSAVNSLLKVMSLVALLVAPAIVSLSLGTDASPWLRYGIAVAALVITVAAVAVGRNRRADVVTEGMGQTPIT